MSLSNPQPLLKRRGFLALAVATLICILAVGITFILSQQKVSSTAKSISQVENAVQVNTRSITTLSKDIPLEPTVSGQQIHYHVAVRLTAKDGLTLPPIGVGHSHRGILAIHTHYLDGVIHIHQPKRGITLTLQDVWKAWGLEVNNKTFVGLQPYCVYINNKPVSVDEPIVLKDHDDIQVDFAECGKKTTNLEKFDWEAAKVYDQEEYKD